MDDHSKSLLFDVVDSAQAILGWCAARTFDEYTSDRFLRRAVEREFEIIGEALNRLASVDTETAGRISELRRIVDFRNRIIHGYQSVSNAAVWAVIEGRLPKLLAEADALLKGAEDDT